MAMTKEQAQLGVKVKINPSYDLYSHKFKGLEGTIKHIYNDNIGIEFSKLPGGHNLNNNINNNNGWYLLPQYLDLVTNSDAPTKSSQPEQQLITGVPLKLKSSGILSGLPERLYGTFIRIKSYSTYHSSQRGYFVQLEEGFTAYESDFEAFEGPTDEVVQVKPSIAYEPYITPDTTYKTGIEPYRTESTLAPITTVSADIAEPEIKVTLDTKLFIGKKLPILNTDF